MGDFLIKFIGKFIHEFVCKLMGEFMGSSNVNIIVIILCSRTCLDYFSLNVL